MMAAQPVRVRKPYLAFVLLLWLAGSSAPADGASIERDLGELRLDLGGNWKIVLDGDNVGLGRGWWKKPPPGGEVRSIQVPSCFEKTHWGAGWDSVVWYYHDFEIPRDFRGKDLYIEFGAVNYACRAWLNGTEIGRHEGGYHGFRFSLKGAAKIGATNHLVVRVVDPGKEPVDGLTLRSIPNGKESWYFNFGGIYRPVVLVGKPPVSVEDVFVAADPKTGKVSAGVEIARRADGPSSVALELKVTKEQPGGDSRKILASLEKRLVLEPGANRIKAELEVANPAAWSPDSPNLYKLTARAGDFSRKSVVFGFRSFEIKNGRFYLNGRPIFVRGVVYQPYFPRTLAYPPSKGFTRREVSMMKQAGFNLVRCHAGVAPPELLDAADRGGLMVIEEPSLGWVYGPLDAIAKPSLAEVEGMVRRDRNHPCIVAWGTISQGGGDLAKMGDLLARRALQLDPTRPVFGDWPARWVEDSEPDACKVYLPGSTEPVPISGGQIFPTVPVSEQTRERLNTLGTTGSLNFVSAVGSGGMPDFGRCLEGFQGRDYLEDYRLVRRYRDNAQKDLDTFRLNRIFGNIGEIARQSQRVQAKAAQKIIGALRTNPNLAGYCWSQWRDAAWECNTGVVDFWANPKTVFDKLRNTNRPVSLALEIKPDAARLDDPVAIRAVAINDARVKGTYEVALEIRRPDRRVVKERKAKIRLYPGARLVPLSVMRLHLSGGPSGFWIVRARLTAPSGKKVAEIERRFLYVGRKEWDLSNYDILAVGVGSKERSVLAASGLMVLAPPAWPKSKIAAAPARGAIWRDRARFEPVADALEQINREGGALLLDCSKGLDPAVERLHILQEGKLNPTAGGFIGKFLLVRSTSRFAWFPVPKAMAEEFGSVAPRTAVFTREPTWEPYIAVVDGYGRFGGYVWAEKPWGAGRIVLLTLPIFEKADLDPTAHLLLLDLLRYYSSHSRMGAPGPVSRETLLDQFETGGDISPMEWWICGPFEAANVTEAFDKAFGPESRPDPKHSYNAAGGKVVRWRRYKSPVSGHINFSEALGANDNAAAYALTYFYSEKPAEVALFLGSDDAIKVFLNGRLVFQNRVERSAAPAQDRASLKVEKGWNSLLLKVANGSGEWEAYVSINRALLWSPDRKRPPLGFSR